MRWVLDFLVMPPGVSKLGFSPLVGGVTVFGSAIIVSVDFGGLVCITWLPISVMTLSMSSICRRIVL